LLDAVFAEKAKEMNLTSVDNITSKWETVELINFMAALKPRSYREALQNFEYCLSTGIKTFQIISHIVSKRDIIVKKCLKLRSSANLFPS